MKDKKENEQDYLGLISIVVVIIIFAAWLITYCSLKDLSYDERGSFGDMFGSVNAIFSGLALAGIILTILLQRKELKLQREELHQTRIEFLLNRTTTLAYNQLERFEASIKNFEIIYGGGCHYKGHNAIVELYKVYEAHYDSKDKSLEENNQSKIALNAKYSKILNGNRDEVENFSHNIYNSVQALESIIYKSTLEIEDLNNIKNIFFENIGFITMSVIENIINNTTEQLEVFETNDYIKHNINIGEMQHSIIFLKPVVEFYSARLTEENFDELKEKWKSKKGSNY